MIRLHGKLPHPAQCVYVSLPVVIPGILTVIRQQKPGIIHARTESIVYGSTAVAEVEGRRGQEALPVYLLQKAVAVGVGMPPAGIHKSCSNRPLPRVNHGGGHIPVPSVAVVGDGEGLGLLFCFERKCGYPPLGAMQYSIGR